MNKKTAKETFEKLGYKQLGSFKPDDDYIIVAYKKEYYGDYLYVYFYGANEIRITMEDNKGRIYPPIFDLELLQAINQQVKELKWYE